MTDFDPTLSQLQDIQAAFDVDNFSGANTPEGKRTHVLWHLQGLVAKLAAFELALSTGEATTDVLTEEVIPDLLVYAAMLAEIEGNELPEVYKRRLEQLEARNQTPGSAQRAIDAGTDA